MRSILFAIAIAALSCKRSETPPAPSAELAIAPGSAWIAERAGDAPMLLGPHGARVFVTTAKSADRMPGIAIGSEAGPELALLGGEFAPLVVPDRTDRAYDVRIESRGATLAVDFRGAFGARVFAEKDRVRIAVEGRANVVLPSGQTAVKGFRDGRPVFAEKVTAWSEASIQAKQVDRIEVDTERRGTIVVETECAPRVMRPRARANTSSFVLRTGPPRDDFDATYAPADARDTAPPCTGTATISIVRS